jgi:hypothetical protein
MNGVAGYEAGTEETQPIKAKAALAAFLGK